MIHEDLGLVFQSAKGARVNNPVTVTLKLIATLRVRFWMFSATRLGRISSLGGEGCHH